MMIECLFKKLTDLHYKFFGSKTLKPLEQFCLEAWRASLADEDKQILDAQLEAAQFVQRGAGGAKVCFYYPKREDIPVFKTSVPVFHAATVVLRCPDPAKEPQMPVRIFVVRGRFFSIEFPKRAERYFKLHDTPEGLQVAQVVTHDTLHWTDNSRAPDSSRAPCTSRPLRERSESYIPPNEHMRVDGTRWKSRGMSPVFRIAIGLLCLMLAVVCLLLIAIGGPEGREREIGTAYAFIVAGAWAFALLVPWGRARPHSGAAGRLGVGMVAVCVGAAIEGHWGAVLFAGWVGYVAISFGLARKSTSAYRFIEAGQKEPGNRKRLP